MRLGSVLLSVFSSRDRLRRLPLLRGGINSVAAESGVSERSLSVCRARAVFAGMSLTMIVVYWSVFFLYRKKRQAYGLS